MSTGEGNEDDEESQTLLDSFIKAEEVINDIEEGRSSSGDLQNRIKFAATVLEELSRNVSTLGLFSDNEEVEDLTTSSLRFLLIPCYLGVAHHNMVTEPSKRAEQLQLAKAYYHDFLQRLQCYGFDIEKSPLIFRQDGDESNSAGRKYTSEEIREHKIARFRRQKEFKDIITQLKCERQLNKMDESVQRKLYVTSLKYWSSKILEELESIEEELPLIEMMQNRMQTSDTEKDPSTNSLLTDKKSATLKPFILTRSVQQKSVFGLGYPSIPTMTVDEWYNQQFGKTSLRQQEEVKKRCTKSNLEDQRLSEGEHEENDEKTRAELMKWDEYKDFHRRGWGNTHNKG